MLTVQRVRGGARKALLQRRVVQLGSLTARRDRLLEPDAMALVSRGPGDLKAGQRPLGTLAQWEGPPALRGTTSKKSATESREFLAEREEVVTRSHARYVAQAENGS